MTPRNDVENKLGFDQVRHWLKSFCLSELGIRKIGEIHFSDNATQIVEQLNHTSEFKQIFERGDDFPCGNYFDPSGLFAKAVVEGTYLDESEFLNIGLSLQTIFACRNYIVKNKESCPALFSLTQAVSTSPATSVQIFEIIDENGLVRDSASAELKKIRKRLRDEQVRSRKLIDQIFKEAVNQRWIPEGALPTIRSGRLVLPVLAEHKRKLSGFIHDESATGHTVFLEPAEALEINNEIRDLEHAEKRETIRILMRLTDSLRQQLHQLVRDYEFLSQMEFIRAKAKLALETRSMMPAVSSKPAMNWINVRHPLLELSLKGKRDVVPLNIDLNETDRMLLVSGPNAGGKSVCLKTVGLVQYMLQCGLLVPASPDSTVGVFHDIFVDIGDQQSIENDLSTYSSHLKNMSRFIRESDKNTLVLVDELGSGTDPNFGGAIAQAVLQSLIEKGAWGIATTHYHNLKLFANTQKGIRNAAMRFDDLKMQPLYTLDIGKPGSSFALEIAERTGLPYKTLEAARQLAGKELVSFETLIRNLESEKNLLTEKLSNLLLKEAELTNLLTVYHRLKEDLESRKKQIVNRAKEEARNLLEEANREIEKTIRHIRENQAQKTETIKARKGLNQLNRKLSGQDFRNPPVTSAPIETGDSVRIVGQNGSGIVLSVKGKSAMVQFGEIKSKVDLAKLEKTTLPTSTVESRGHALSLGLNEKRSVYSNVLDIRGKRAEEVAPILDKFLDESVLVGQGEVKILHGKGEGVLRKIVREQLRKYSQVASVADEHVERGGDGITVVILK